MIKACLGIDPGKQGAVCLYVPDHTIEFVDWPKNDEPDEIIRSIQKWKCRSSEFNVVIALLEKVHSMPREGVSSAFSFGKNCGMWSAILKCLRIPHILQTPQQWRKGLVTPSDGPDPKWANYNVALRLFPDMREQLTKRPSKANPKGAPKDGRVDALLMAYKACKEWT